MTTPHLIDCDLDKVHRPKRSQRASSRTGSRAPVFNVQAGVDQKSLVRARSIVMFIRANTVYSPMLQTRTFSYADNAKLRCYAALPCDQSYPGKRPTGVHDPVQAIFLQILNRLSKRYHLVQMIFELVLCFLLSLSLSSYLVYTSIHKISCFQNLESALSYAEVLR
jgi:hypothetical protein